MLSTLEHTINQCPVPPSCTAHQLGAPVDLINYTLITSNQSTLFKGVGASQTLLVSKSCEHNKASFLFTRLMLSRVSTVWSKFVKYNTSIFLIYTFSNIPTHELQTNETLSPTQHNQSIRIKQDEQPGGK